MFTLKSKMDSLQKEKNETIKTLMYDLEREQDKTQELVNEIIILRQKLEEARDLKSVLKLLTNPNYTPSSPLKCRTYLRMK